MHSSVQEDDVAELTSSVRRTILLVAEVALVRVALRQLLSGAEEVSVVGEAAPGQALVSARRLKPDIAIVDSMQVDEALVSFLQQLSQVSPETRAIVLSDDEFIAGPVQVSQAGAWGYLPRDISDAEIIRAVRLVAQGRAVMECALAPEQFIGLGRFHPNETESPNPLSQRESTVIRTMAQGYTDSQIAHELAMSVPTVKTHVRSILRKMQSRNRAAAIAVAFRNGVLR